MFGWVYARFVDGAFVTYVKCGAQCVYDVSIDKWSVNANNVLEVWSSSSRVEAYGFGIIAGRKYVCIYMRKYTNKINSKYSKLIAPYLLFKSLYILR